MRAERARVQEYGGNAGMVHYIWWVHFLACYFPRQLPLAVASYSREEIPTALSEHNGQSRD